MREVVSVSDLSIGEQVAQATYLFSREALVRYAGASGDFNPIHYRDSVAKSVGLPGVLAHGMLTMAAAVQCVVEWIGDSGRILDYQARFTRPVVVPGEGGVELNIVGKVATVDPQAGTARVDLTATVAGHTVLAKAQVMVRVDEPAVDERRVDTRD